MPKIKGLPTPKSKFTIVLQQRDFDGKLLNKTTEFSCNTGEAAFDFLNRMTPKKLKHGEPWDDKQRMGKTNTGNHL